MRTTVCTEHTEKGRKAEREAFNKRAQNNAASQPLIYNTLRFSVNVSVGVQPRAPSCTPEGKPAGVLSA